MLPWHILAPAVRLGVGVAIVWGFVYAVSAAYRHFAPAQFEYLFGKVGHASPVAHGPPQLPPQASHFTELSFGHLRYTTMALNEWFIGIGSRYNRFLQIWFSIGVLFGILTMLASGPLLLLGSVKIVQGILGYASPEALAAATGKTVDEYDIDFAEWAGRKGQFLVTVIPGVNLPLSQIWYYLVAVALAALVHEGGHAVAATVERIPLHSFGFFVFLMYPGAYVNLDSNALHMLHPFRQLRVICAGAWHNIVLFIVSYLLLNSLPVTMKWGYTTVGEVAGGLVVSKVEQGSPLYGHILPGSVVAKIGDSKIWDEASWEDALRHSLKNRSSVMVPYCVPQPEIDGNTLDCCNVTYEHPLSDTQYQCFWSRDLLDKWDRDHPWTAAHAGDLARRPNDTSWFRYSSTLVNSMGTVDRGQATGDLAKPAKGQAACASLHSLRAGGILCGDGRTNCSEFNGACMAPFIPNPHVRLLSIWVEDEPTKRKLGKAGGAQAEKASETRQLREVMFLGDPREVWEAVAVGTLFPKYAVLPVTLPTAIEMFLHHLISLSAALTFLNMIPAYRLDGAHAFSCFLDIVWPTSGSVGTGGPAALAIARKRQVEKVVSSAATALLIFAMVVGVLGAVQSGEQSLAVVETFHGKDVE